MKNSTLILLAILFGHFFEVRSQTSEEQVALEKLVNSWLIDIEFSSDARSIQKSYKKDLNLDLGYSKKNGTYCTKFSEVLVFKKIVRNPKSTFPIQINFELSKARYPARYDDSFQEKATSLLLISKINGTSLFDKIITTSSFILNEDPSKISIGVLMQPLTVYNFNFVNLYPKDSRPVYGTNKIVSEYCSAMNRSWHEIMNPFSIGQELISGDLQLEDGGFENEDSLQNFIIKKVISSLKKRYKEFSIKEKNLFQIEISNARNLLTANDNYWELIELTFCSISLRDRTLRYNVLVNGNYYNAGSRYPAMDVIRKDGKSFDPTYTANGKVFIRNIFNEINR